MNPCQMEPVRSEVIQPSEAISCGAAEKLPVSAMVQRNVLVVDDDAGMRAALEVSFRQRGWRVEKAGWIGEAVAKFRRDPAELVVTDIRMPQGDGFAVMHELRQIVPRLPVILLTAFANIPDAVTAMKNGACDYLVKPVTVEQLEQSAARMLGQPADRVPATEFALGETGLVGQSPRWLNALARARQVAESNADVLIHAESGSGKELLARMIHGLSPRRGRPFIAVNCAALPEALLESELFGHAKGAFTGAVTARPGKFELAHGGTLLLDEVGEMPLALQPKLLRALQEREFDRLGETRSVRVDIRVIATTHRSLKTMVEQGQFRADLYYRLHVIPLSLPPLRERRDDIVLLARHFVRQYAVGGNEPMLSQEFMAVLEAHSWPGNVRELENLMRRAVALCPEQIGLEVLDPCELETGGVATGRPHLLTMQTADTREASATAQASAGTSLEEMERRLIESTLVATGGNRSRAAQLLGVSLRTVRNKIRVYGLPARSCYDEDKVGLG